MVPPNKKMNTRKASVQSLNDGEVEISKLISELEGDSKNIVLILSNQLNSFRSEFTELLTAKNDEISALKTKVAVLEDKVVKLETSIDDNDAYERKDTVIFSGSSIPAGEVGENCGEVIRSVARESLRIEMSLSEISVAHRLGRKPQNQTPDNRPIIVKLCRRDMKTSLISASRKLRSSTLYINENLTAPRRKILYILRQLKKDHPDLIVGCGSYDGKVYAYTKSTSSQNTRHLVNTRESLVEFCRRYVRVPIDRFLDDWQY